MPQTSHQETTTSFLGLQSYTEAQSNVFFGRDAETDTLTSLVHLNTLTILFGRSGTGKTSLLNAGVFPRLRKNSCLPFRIRLEFSDTSPDLVTQVKKTLKVEIDKYGFKVGSYPGAETLWEYFHKEALWKTVTPIIVFDQFEEIFTLAKSNLRFASKELPAFWEELSDLIENNIPEKLKSEFIDQKDKIGYNYKKQKAKIVFGFREEYLPEFESITSKIPSLKYSRFRLMPMNGNQAYEVITKTWKEKINPTEAKHIVSYFTNEQGFDDYSLITVEPSLLSQVCAYIDKERIESGHEKVSAELLNKYPKEIILRAIYDEAMNEANNSLSKNENENRNLVKEFTEEKLITVEGYRTRYNLGTADEMIRPCINVLAAKYFVREDDEVVELTHDVLIPIIKSDREKRRNQIEAERLREKTRKRIKKILIIFLVLAAISFLGVIWAAWMEKRRLANKADELQKEIASDSLRWMGFRDLVKADSLRHDSLRKNPPKVDTLYKDTTLTKHYVDNIDTLLFHLNDLSNDFADLNLKNENDIKKLNQWIKNRPSLGVVSLREYDSVRFRLETLQTSYDSLLRQMDTLRMNHNKTIAQLRDRIIELEKTINKLNDENKSLRRQIADLIRNCQFPPLPCTNIDTANSLRLQLKYTSAKDYYPTLLPDKIKIYMIPFTDKNMTVIKAASIYDRYDEHRLANAEGSIMGQYCNSYFTFSNLKPGTKYLIKICTLYGNYTTYQKTAAGSETLTLEAVPPVKNKNR